MDIQKEVKKAKKGHRGAFEKLVLYYQVMMYRVAKTILSRDEDCADAIQETILKAYEKISTLREPKYFKSWLIRILMNECYQIGRQRKRVVSIEEWVEPSSLDSGYEKIEVTELLHKLPSEQRELLQFYHIEDISIYDLSVIYEVPENTIKTRLRRARENVRDIFQKEDDSKWINGKIK
ncbi:sigma-70 family RNA polymerase sigma factor [Evansella sp. AB-P1]|uniref:RNA polymerase sigma factor n=1 Tax=Evansella sp. AB-P1 TaxID=3037653 RepID=UPI00241FFB9E|nr:sigma-70 family RNA polymerase sigma factor [Evansella sp. AB-P1]MDG5788545.1 sigma-70 family RNA polymerase sigma factor [Evansella sp. AB-P1]